jgi:hypothetical protein
MGKVGRYVVAVSAVVSAPSVSELHRKSGRAPQRVSLGLERRAKPGEYGGLKLANGSRILGSLL